MCSYFISGQCSLFVPENRNIEEKIGPKNIQVHYRGKKIREKWLNFLQVTKFFPDEIFPQLSFSRPVFFPNFFSPEKEFIPIFSGCYYYHAYFDALYLSWLSKAVLTKILKCEWKQGIEKNNNTDINTTRNFTFVNFKNYTTLKTS